MFHSGNNTRSQCLTLNMILYHIYIYIYIYIFFFFFSFPVLALLNQIFQLNSFSPSGLVSITISLTTGSFSFHRKILPSSGFFWQHYH
jgi:hypothetical protein